jgi:hypothetical protein
LAIPEIVYTFPVLPTQGVAGPVIEPAAAGSGLTVTEYDVEAVPVLQGFEGVTVMVPETALAEVLTVIEFVPLPAVIVNPDGNVHAYEVAFVTAVVLYTNPVWD